MKTATVDATKDDSSPTHNGAKKKLLLAVTKSNWGGAQKYVYDLASALAGTFDVVVLTGEKGELTEKLSRSRVKTIFLQELSRDVYFLKDWAVFNKCLDIFKKEKPDIVHLNSSKMGGIGGLAARIAGTPKIIFTAHGWAFNENRPFWQKIIIRFFVWLTILLSHKTIAVSEKTKNDASSFPVVGNKISVIPNGLKKPDFFDRTTAIKKLPIRNTSKNVLRLVTVSELHKNKGLDFSIEAINKIRDVVPVSYYIIGSGEEKKSLEKIIKDKGLSDIVRLLGQIPEAAKFLKAFDLFILPSRTEAFGYALLEAGFAGLPVIASDVGGIPEIISGWKVGFLFPPGNAEKLAEAIKILYFDSRLRKSIGENLRERVGDKFSLEKMLFETEKIYLSQT